ncbi:hypothetical protein LCL95_09210 [Bacillus timonensis]|nr:hypothetical protein [Bacillus timonensis]
MELIIIGLIVGILCGIVPAVVGAVKQRIGLAIGGFFACAVSGVILGLLLAVPVMALFLYFIMKGSKKDGEEVYSKGTE